MLTFVGVRYLLSNARGMTCSTGKLAFFVSDRSALHLMCHTFLFNSMSNSRDFTFQKEKLLFV
jgi:hypothetical protein